MKTLSRPMFRRGGSTGGITSNLKKPRVGLYGGGPPKMTDTQEILAKYMQMPEEPKGLTSSDYLRLAAAGAEIMGTQPTSDGSGFLAALSSAGPALSGAATDIAENLQTRKENYRTGKRDYDIAMGQAAASDAARQDEAALEDYRSDKDFGQQTELLKLEFGYSEKLLNKEAQNAMDLLIQEQSAYPEKRYDFEKQFVEVKGKQLIAEAVAAIEAGDKETYEEKKSQFLNGLYGESTRANTEEKANLLADADFQKALRLETDAIMAPGGEVEQEGSKYFGKTRSQVALMVKQNAFSQVVSQVYFPEFKAKGGRVGLANGGDPDFPDATPVGPPFEPGSGPNPDPGSPPIMATNPNMREGASSADIEMTFAELRRRLPPEVNDGVIKLIMSSEQAMIDFAQLMTPDDISTFNEKYNVDLQYPTQVA
jgi:hypothetical protein